MWPGPRGTCVREGHGVCAQGTVPPGPASVAWPAQPVTLILDAQCRRCEVSKAPVVSMLW